MTRIEQYAIDKAIKLRTEHNLTQAQIAESLGVSRGFVANVENPFKRAKYNLNHINALAEVFDCPPGHFLPEKPFPVDY